MVMLFMPVALQVVFLTTNMFSFYAACYQVIPGNTTLKAAKHLIVQVKWEQRAQLTNDLQLRTFEGIA